MTKAMTVRLDDETARQLDDLAVGQASRSAAVQDAIRTAWEQLQQAKLAAGYAAAVADNPLYPYESAEEIRAHRARRRRRESGAP